MTAGQWRWCVVLAVLAGASARLLGGGAEALDGSRPVSDLSWQLPSAPVKERQAFDKIWQSRKPFGASAESLATASVIASSPQGTITVAGERFALFVQADGKVIRVAEGGALPAGGRVVTVTATAVVWVDAAGSERTTSLLMADRASTRMHDAGRPDDGRPPGSLQH